MIITLESASLINGYYPAVGIYTDLVKEMCEYYHVDYSVQLYSYFSSKLGSPAFINWVKKHKKLTMEYFHFSDEFSSIFAYGFDLTEDKHSDMFMLSRK